MKINLKNFISTDYFYRSHHNEISKYINRNTKYLNIFNQNSNVTKGLFENTLYLNEGESINNALKENVTSQKLDVIILSNIFELSDDIYETLKNIKPYLKNEGLLILNSVNPFWYLILNIFEKIGFKEPSNFKAYIKPKKIENILKAASYEKITNYNRLFIPLKLFGFGPAINFLINLLLPFFNIGINNYLIYTNQKIENTPLTKSIIIPAKNEEGNLEELIDRIPNFKTHYEIIIICGESTDNTYEKSIQLMNQNKNLDIRVLKQSGNGKANAVWEGLEETRNDVLAILDSDLSVDPEKLEDFFEIIENGRADFVNGTRLIYKMEKGAMQILNKFGNLFFQSIISNLISIKLTDSLCGTKVFKRKNIDMIKNWQRKMSFSDPFCDFDLIFSAAYSSQKIVELPIHYRSRKYGKTNISRFRDGWKLLFYFINSYILLKTNIK